MEMSFVNLYADRKLVGMWGTRDYGEGLER
jgi:hypothetical protein